MHRLILLMFVVTASACAASGDEGFFIRNNLQPGPNCTLAAGGAFLSRGQIELESPNPYILTPEIESRIEVNEGQDPTQRRIALKGARVELTVEGMTRNNLSETAPMIANPRFTSLFSASLDPLGTTAVSFDAISSAVLGDLESKVMRAPTDSIRIQLVAKITVFGSLGGGGDEVEGIPFTYPITVCTNCVTTSLGTCPLPIGTPLRDGANGCNIYQDGAVDCCTSATGLVCPGTVATTPPA